MRLPELLRTLVPLGQELEAKNTGLWGFSAVPGMKEKIIEATMVFILLAALGASRVWGVGFGVSRV